MPNAVALLSRFSKVAEMEIEACLKSPYFGEAWVQLEALSPALRKSQVKTCDLPTEMLVARKILESLKGRSSAVTRVSTDLADNPHFAATEQP